MHIQLVNFNLESMSEAEFAKACEEQFAPLFRDVPGLISKVWLSSPETNTYGGVYTWQNKDAMEEFQRSELFKMLAANPRFINVSIRDFAVMERPTRLTQRLTKAASESW